MGRYILALSIVAITLLTACTVPRTPNARLIQSDSASYVVTDARQRVVAGTSLGAFSRPGLADPEGILCSEPSPDVATAVATSFSGALSVFGKGSASLSEGQVESMAQLVERTASIQLLRDKMYQTCLAYANGAISGTTYSLIMAQLDKTIVTLLLGENAAAAFGRAGAAAGTEAAAEGKGSVAGPGDSGDLDEAVDAVAESQEQLKSAEEKLAAVHKDKGEACGLEKGSDAGPGDACKAIDAESAKVAAAQNRLDATLRVLQTTATVQTNIRAGTTKVSGIGGLSRTPTPELARELRLIQDNFLSEDSVDSFLPTCVVELGLHNEPGSTAGRILDLLVAQYDTAASEEQRAPPAERSRATQKTATARNDLDSFLRDPSKLVAEFTAGNIRDPHEQVFNEVLERWRKGVTTEDKARGIDSATIADLAAAANLNRRSLLAALCVKYLPDHLRWTRMIAQTYRMERLEVLRQIELAGRGEQQLSIRAAALTQFTVAMTACKEGDIKQKSACEKVVREIVSGDGEPVDQKKSPPQPNPEDDS